MEIEINHLSGHSRCNGGSVGHPMIYREIRRELKRARKLHAWPVDQVHQVAKIAEEAGEALQAANNHLESGASIDFIRVEVIQTIVTCLRWLKNNPRNRRAG